MGSLPKYKYIKFHGKVPEIREASNGVKAIGSEAKKKKPIAKRPYFFLNFRFLVFFSGLLILFLVYFCSPDLTNHVLICLWLKVNYLTYINERSHHCIRIYHWIYNIKYKLLIFGLPLCSFATILVKHSYHTVK